MLENHDGRTRGGHRGYRAERDVDILSLFTSTWWGFFFSLLLSLCAKNRDLQGLAADEVGPGADLRGDTLNAGQLLAHALSKELGSL